ncbi:aldo/keto reductase [Streptomyces zagrosensis]|uniref:Aryl-alcohol dehydrogenase-like predicted oxidoreductase n=1 Tax=Streptomyces zagrosensis TaxID=1042984 RepID=A0A7W9UYW1_9ACTN|nr:aldo/keto reductase [Streptomyces zagrosensis]MBB5936375.1 aryl-alcohol dehydrogenase-like predicted oxidoreductase [Streptomyces zagrosensis]
MLVGIAAQTDRTVLQAALNWLLTRPTVAAVISGARNEEQLWDALGAVGWQLDLAQLSRLGKAGSPPCPLPMYSRLRGFKPSNPPLV